VTLRLRAEAAQEIDEAFAYYEAQSPGLGSRFINEIERGYDQIEAYPKAWPRVRRHARWYILRRFPFAITYLEQPAQITVVAIAHLSRRRAYWLNRLKRS
jgi:plasmid stabilization system protein ParE